MHQGSADFCAHATQLFTWVSMLLSIFLCRNSDTHRPCEFRCIDSKQALCQCHVVIVLISPALYEPLGVYFVDV